MSLDFTAINPAAARAERRLALARRATCRAGRSTSSSAAA